MHYILEVIKYKLNEENITRMKETVDQRMHLKAQKLQRYEKHGKLCRQNVTFKNDTNKFYREIWKEKVTVNKIPAINAIENFWDTIWIEKKALMRKQSE